MRYILFLAVICQCPFTVASDPEDEPPPPSEGKAWKLVWHDEFDGDKLDKSKWTYRPDGKRKGGWWSREAISLDGDGHLVITTFMDGDKPTDGCITIQGKFQHAFGYYVARVKFQKEPGHWSAFWITGPGVGSVGDGGRDGTEIDIMEKPWLDDRVQHAFHWDGYGEHHKHEGVKAKVLAHADEPLPSIIGADISWVQQQEAKGGRWTDEGVEKDILTILKDHGFNWIRLRVFVDPKAEGGYSKEGYCDLQHTLLMAKRIKSAGMGFLLDFHYSDTWADPGHQRKPKAWVDLHGADLNKAVHEHTRDVMTALKNQGTPPDMVQIGNEINHGMLWPDGKVWETGKWDVFCGLIKAGIAGAKEVDPSVKIVVHLALGGQNAKSKAFLERALAHGVEFDILGQSYYPKWHGTLEDVKANLTDLAQRYKQPIIVVEYSLPNIREINDIARGLPNGKGLGTFIWEPTKWGGPALFDARGNTKPEIDLYLEMAKEYGRGYPDRQARQ
jgi:arabinogalactan endo-1,4-beta-galactosidase